MTFQDGPVRVEQREPHDDHDLPDAVSPPVEPRAAYRWPHLNHKSEALARRVALPWRSDSDQITRVSGKKRMPGLAEEPRRARTGHRRGGLPTMKCVAERSSGQASIR